MTITVLNGSPKGHRSVTLQYVEYLARRFPAVRFLVHDVARRIDALEREERRLEEVVTAVQGSEAVLWAFPLYMILICSQYKRFLELIEERGLTGAFAGRYAATLSTSINFHDHAAHEYLRGVCEDWQMRYAGSYSAQMRDLLRPAERERLDGFAGELLELICRRQETARVHAPLVAAAGDLFLPPPPERCSHEGLNVVVLTDAQPQQPRLQALLERFRGAFAQPPELVNLHDLDILGGCQGCLRCGAAYRCAYTGKDGFQEFYDRTLRPADVIVFSGALTVRQLSWKWRQFFDRSFFNTHSPSLTGKQMAFLVSGPLSQLPEFRQVYEAWVELQRSHLVEFVSDEGEPRVVSARLDGLAGRLVRLARTGYVRPRTFLGIAGMKVFRDELWGGLKVVFRADHRAYRRAGYYDFPQRNLLGRLLVALLWVVTGLPGIRTRFPGMVKAQMLRPYAPVLERTRPLAEEAEQNARRERGRGAAALSSAG